MHDPSLRRRPGGPLHSAILLALALIAFSGTRPLGPPAARAQSPTQRQSESAQSVPGVPEADGADPSAGAVPGSTGEPSSPGADGVAPFPGAHGSAQAAARGGLTPQQYKASLERQITKLLENGQEALLDYRAARAEFYLRRAIDLRPEYTKALKRFRRDAGYVDNARLMLINSLILQGRYREAEAELHAAIDEEKSTNYRRAEYQGYMGRKDFGYALKTGYHLLLASNLAMQGRWQEAAVAMDEAAENEAAFYRSEFAHLLSDFYLMLPLTQASIHAQRGEYGEAERTLASAVANPKGRIRPSQLARKPEAAFLLGLIYTYQDKAERAGTLFTAITQVEAEHDPRLPVQPWQMRHLGYLGLGLVEVGRRDYAEAEAQWKRGLEELEQPGINGRAYFRGYFLGCLAMMRLREALGPDGGFYPETLDEAEVLFREALANIQNSAGNRATVYLLLQLERAGLHIARGKPAEARAEIDRAQLLFDEQGFTPDHPVRAWCHLYAFTIAALEGDEAAGREQLALFDTHFRARFDPWDAGLPESTEFCAELLRRRGKARAARVLFEYVD